MKQLLLDRVLGVMAGVDLVGGELDQVVADVVGTSRLTTTRLRRSPR